VFAIIDFALSKPRSSFGTRDAAMAIVQRINAAQRREDMNRNYVFLCGVTEAMNRNYLFLCGVMWAQHASEDAGQELYRALRSDDPDLVLLASALLDQRVASA
jgi:hypothetical protein